MAKTRVLWLSRQAWAYRLWSGEPQWNEYNFVGTGRLYSFCPWIFHKICPSLKLRKNTKCKVKLTNLKNGIKLEKIK